METVRDRMVHLMDSLIAVVDRIAEKEHATPEEIAALPAIADAVVHITGYAVIEKK